MAKNYTLEYFAAPGDGVGGILGFAWSYTLPESQAYFDSLNAGGSGAIPPALYYILISKNTVATLLALATVGLGGNISLLAGVITQDRKLARNFSIDNPGTQPWTFDDTDKQWSENIQIAKQRLAVTGKTKVGTFKVTVFQLLMLTYNTLSTFDRNALGFAAASELKAIIQRLVDRKITDTQALTAYENLVAKYHRLFY